MLTSSRVKELLELYSLPIEELIDISANVTKENFDNQVEFCSIVSAITGKCGENCGYCAQSSHHRTNIECHPLLSIDEVLKSAKESKENGVKRFSIVTSGKTPENNNFKQILKMVEEVSQIDGLKVCASLGFLTDEQFIQLKEAGMERYHHNLNTSRSYYSEICTTHSFQERIDTILQAQKHGLEVCCGGIIGMGESRKQRIEMALEIAELNPESAPINILHPIEGTPVYKFANDIDEEEILRTLAIYRIIMPKVVLRYAGGRRLRLSEKHQELGLKAGINGILVGNYLTTIGITPEQDKDMLLRTQKVLKK